MGMAVCSPPVGSDGVAQSSGDDGSGVVVVETECGGEGVKLRCAGWFQHIFLTSPVLRFLTISS